MKMCQHICVNIDCLSTAYKKEVTSRPIFFHVGLSRGVATRPSHNKKAQKSYLELQNHISEITLFSSTFKIEENNVPSEM